ncbi:MAG: GDSL-type esterase/lipase family protein [Pirellulaceae bacterium]
MGGSITEMNGYRPMLCEFLERRFPETKFTFTDAGISSTCSTTGAFRLDRDVLSKGPVDLFFVEFAVNDDQDAMHARRECIRGMEGIVRHVRQHNPNADIIITYFVNPGMMEKLGRDEEPISTGAHEAVAEQYQVSTVHLAREVTERIANGTLTWEKYGGVHPAPYGNRIAADMVIELLTSAWEANETVAADSQRNAKRPHAMPETMLDPHSYVNGRFISPAEATIESGWKWETPNWTSIPGQLRGRYANRPLLSADAPNSVMTLNFTGNAIGAFLLAGPDAGFVEVSVDEGTFRPIDLYHRFSGGLHYPRTVMFATDLPQGAHVLRLRTTEKSNSASKGVAARILEFTVN